MLRDPFLPVHDAVKELVSLAKSPEAKIELIDMLISHLEQAKKNLREETRTTRAGTENP